MYSINFKEKHFRMKKNLKCLENISKDWSVDSINKTVLNGYVYGFGVDYDATEVDDILDTHK